ncbi:hypothetical protein K493DRAFT_310176 [Basidiobolus meristosporus CBS 931.73]|uniref:C2H2-type domain-containing protein n=1 Tax=Basidiobolus meristosporus CBS 931.73 TaxID=1314790 RepID=A0A1Y1ZAU3_9FUNG|nr:hypothetical protein K493DRAFT_310176 [Basidiobolus meristosporus CBS 931.73]|eukprot:ORY07433.1 hypothetical protein K493DRAFT_310176 [Basidiobolus meristosporus CBS 931.73]
MKATATRTTYRRKPIQITCSVCQKSFNRKDNYMRHFRTHTGEYPHPCPHTNCGKGFTRSDQLLRHLNSKHAELAPRTGSPESDCGSATSEDSLQTVADHLVPDYTIPDYRKQAFSQSPMCIKNLVNDTVLISPRLESRMELNFLLN